MNISIIIPVLNEADKLKDFILDALLFAKTASFKTEFIFIDDHSTDSTPRILKEYGLTVITHDKNLGYGASLKSGISRANGDWVCIIDADNTYSLKELGSFLAFTGFYDMVVGARRLNSGVFPFYQRLAKGLIQALLTSVFKVKILDINSGFRLIKKSIVKEYIGILPDGFSFTSSLTLAMLFDKRKIKYTGITYKKRIDASRIRLMNFVINFVRSYWRITLWHLRKTR